MMSSVVPKKSSSSRQAARTSGSEAMSAIEQPASRLGRMTCWCGWQRMSAASAMKCTPQKTMYSASGRSAAYCASMNESPRSSANSMMSSRW